MEMEEINSCKRPRSGAEAAKLGQKDQQHQDDDDDDGEVKMEGSRVRAWQHTTSSRIFRVSRASGGKDRHSKVLTAKGLRDRRVRLSVSTAIQFYDLQDRLGYDQPSKAVEWLIRAASTAIAKLPALDGAFPEPLSQHTGKEKQIDAGMEVDAQDDNEQQQQQQQQQQHLSLSKSGGSSTSETSKGSVLSLSRSESRIKARERARERTAKDNKGKDNQGEDCHVTAAAHHHHSLHSQSSFTELLTGGSGNRTQPSPRGNCIQKQVRQLPQVITTADYFSQAGFFGQSQKNHHHSQSQSPSPPGFSSQPSHFGNSSPMTMVPFNIATATSGDHQEMHQFSFLQDHLNPVTTVPPAGDYSLNFSISPGLAGYNRGTLQSNSSSQLPHNHLPRFSPSPVDGSNLPFLFGTTPSPENQFSAGFDGRLQLCYGDGFKHSDLKGKGKS